MINEKNKKERVFFTADHHWGHAKIIEYSNRPYKDVHEMNEDLIQRWNSVVGKNDTVYHLGDIAFMHRDSPQRTRDILNRLNGDIYYVLGNHDKQINLISGRFEWIKEKPEIAIYDEDAHGGKQFITLCHYAFRVWHCSHHGAWMLYGHSHGSLEEDPKSLSFDVGVDCWDYTPVSYEQVKEKMKSIYI